MRTKKIQEHYDKASPYYRELWDRHLHHGYFETGNESKSEATQKLVDLLIQKADLKKGSKVLDIGCGFGATSNYLTKEFNCDVTAITLSPVQAEMARKAAENLDNPPKFVVQDANNLSVKEKYDIVWTVEMISHLEERKNFFEKVSDSLKPGGKWCIGAWTKKSGLSKAEEEKYIKPIEEGMMVNLPTKEDYLNHVEENNLHLNFCRDMSNKVSKTWDIGLDLIKNPNLWKMAKEEGREFIDFLKAFRSMRKGYSSGNFRYFVMIAEKQ